ncbi:DnaJ domain-containing protein [Desulfosoma caldarium]|uniref:Uncharacterized protein DUF1232 n=1 Tax=Desulfosoma caldarium TaxID=610254 RepID=A0A3N1VJM7_9BACT|nr:DnaJ domain-containing protein [Desulfosoma caldarium]ROR03015.1 uncharacterized protein DUF1232 [Desulfosoma caldarium]
MQKFWPLLAWLAYFILPTDLFPDFVLGPGWVDDLVLLGLVYYFFLRQGTANDSRTSSQSASPRDRRAEYEGGQGAESTRARTQSGAKNPYDILGISPEADMETIKKAYHRKAAQYHPDKVNHLGEELQQLAKEKFQEIQWAYETVMRARGESRP